MLAVSNTSPLRHLIPVGHADLLFRLFGRVLAPPAAALDLADPAAPAQVREWIAAPPPSLELRPLAAPLESALSGLLDPGESEAIQLAAECRADVLILDDWSGRSVARARGLPLVGTVGVLGYAYQRRLIDDPIGLLAVMRGRGFRISAELTTAFEALLETRYRRRS